jgi:hypothetical protein
MWLVHHFCTHIFVYHFINYHLFRSKHADTAMGCNVDAQAKSDSEYVKAVYT